MSIFAAVMTSRGTGAISTIQVFGDSAKSVTGKIFTPAGTKIFEFRPGEIYTGTIHDGDKIIDQVTIGCEPHETIAIHCHGNPLIVEMIMQLLKQHGFTIISAEQFLTIIMPVKKENAAIALEAALVQPKVKTLLGTKIIANQIETGLGKTALNWLGDIDKIHVSEINKQASRVLENSAAAKLIIYGCRTVLTGPPNSGKSTLLNCLCGRQKAIVTDISGTTRDWVTAQCRIEPLFLELIDTAGLDENLSGPVDNIEKAAQKKSMEILDTADIILLVLDGSRILKIPEEKFLEKIAGKKVITILNKSDLPCTITVQCLPARLDTGKLPEALSDFVRISAKEGAGIKELAEKILQKSRAADFNYKTAVCFTNRQENLIRQLTTIESAQNAIPIITELLNGQV